LGRYLKVGGGLSREKIVDERGGRVHMRFQTWVPAGSLSDCGYIGQIGEKQRDAESNSTTAFRELVLRQASKEEHGGS